jgi:hypothetical protein
MTTKINLVDKPPTPPTLWVRLTRAWGEFLDPVSDAEYAEMAAKRAVIEQERDHFEERCERLESVVETMRLKQGQYDHLAEVYRAVEHEVPVVFNDGSLTLAGKVHALVENWRELAADLETALTRIDVLENPHSPYPESQPDYDPTDIFTSEEKDALNRKWDAWKTKVIVGPEKVAKKAAKKTVKKTAKKIVKRDAKVSKRKAARRR